MEGKKLASKALAIAALVLCSPLVTLVRAQDSGSLSTAVKYPSSELSQALATPTSCDCSCDAVKADGSKATAQELLDQKAQLACSTCCESDELLQAMAEFLPESERTTEPGQACNEPQGLLSVFLQPVCWNVPSGAGCQFPFIVGYNQIVIDCTTSNDVKPWCVYDMDAWNSRGEGWGYCAPKAPASDSDPASSSTNTSSPSSSSSSSTAEGGRTYTSDNLDKIIANLTAGQEEYLSSGKNEDVVAQVKDSGGLTPAGIALVVVVVLLIVGIIAGTGVVIWKLRNKIKMRRSSKFQQMEPIGKGGIGPAGPDNNNNQAEVSMTSV